MPGPTRGLAPGQRAELYVADVVTGALTLVHESATLLFEAPNWTPDGAHLLVNGDGRLFRIQVGGGELVEVPLGEIPPINNDHVLSPDGETVYVSANDGHLYAIPFATGLPRRVSNDHGSDFRHYLHGVSPDGSTLAYIGMLIEEGGAVTTNVFTLPAAGGEDTQLTDDPFPDDGSEYSPDGRWIYFNSERASATPGHAQLFRMAPDGTGIEQLSDDERVNWFPHVSPDGRRIVYVSFPPGTIGHPADHDVIIRVIEPDGAVRDLASPFGGQGTMNVASWAPDSTRVAFVAYPVRS
ncbi:TolB family protein [Occultella kanbiaonis]|uniref:TolB family protein n=1 Tax=Occultella kanbiaonis TaxID=2675754 RepID=UPI0013D3955D|nr:PD40 domain-containing protein [Occultella kanbiaonis]